MGRITLDRPTRLNALSAELLAEMVALCGWLHSRADIRVVVVIGEGRAFSAGFDLGDFATPASGNPRDGADLGRLATDALTNVPQLTIAAVRGRCIGGGAVLVAACDLRVASEGALFSIPEVDLGIPLAWGGIPRLVRELGPAVTKELVLTCRPFTANEAKSLRWINTVVAEDELERHVDELATSLATKPAYALRATKTHVNAVVEEMAGTGRSVQDADSLVYAMRDPESRAASMKYLEARRK
ncbi:MAG: enoyl-CoA hydratase/isomerase family protein [Actinobacteria bacterium]|nr:enoyl-CoA hydratase/isomerase family protein [Actinomycetota bacterium]